MPGPGAERGAGSDRPPRRRGGDAVATDGSPGFGTPPDLAGIDVVIFDKDGTLIDFHAMWGGWARELGTRLEATARRPVSPDVFAAIGFDPTTGRVSARGPLASSTMAGIQDVVEAVLRRWCPSVAAARRATEAAWYIPDPVALAAPLADLPALCDALRRGGRRLAVVTTDDRAPTDATLRALGVRTQVEAMVCGDDGFEMKPAPDPVFAVCQALVSEPQRVAVVGDSPADLAMGRAAGAGLVVGVLSGVGTAADLAAADVILGSVQELFAPQG
ncbi:MAG TPA: HAD family hydrolase [Methylomirabilota bacterium]|nr:HAD family hydrolase [Methylomirabilota bacterium]